MRAGNLYAETELAADAVAAGGSPPTSRAAEVLELAADAAPVAEIAERGVLSRRDRTGPSVVAPASDCRRAVVGRLRLRAENRHAAVRLTRERGWV
ncbi:hypothetical protein ASD48_28530 [Streptomyces sp. Root1310]|nr:hypothetical protein ASD48_28530 [Streptomyces sp. Root1310]